MAGAIARVDDIARYHRVLEREIQYLLNRKDRIAGCEPRVGVVPNWRIILKGRSMQPVHLVFFFKGLKEWVVERLISVNLWLEEQAMKALGMFLGVVAAVGLAVGLVACGGGGGGSSSGSATTGSLQVALTDFPADYYSEVTVAIKEISLVVADCEDDDSCEVQSLMTFEPAISRNVLDLVYQQELLGEAAVPAGSYSQLRLILEDNEDGSEPVNYVMLANDDVPGTKYPLQTPSGQTSGMKVLGKFTVTAGETSAIVLDFDVTRAVIQEGNGDWKVKPTGIRIVAMEGVLGEYGALAGTVLPEGAWATAVVSVYPDGSGTAIASGLVNEEDGSFRALVPEGDYQLGVSAEGYQAFDSAVEGATPAGPFTAVLGADTPVADITLAAEEVEEPVESP